MRFLPAPVEPAPSWISLSPIQKLPKSIRIIRQVPFPQGHLNWLSRRLFLCLAPLLLRNQESREPEGDIAQPEQEFTPQVSVQTETPASLDAPEVARDAAAPSESVQPIAETSTPDHLDAVNIPVPDTDEGLYSETVLLASTHLGANDSQGEDLLDSTTLHVSEDFHGPPLAEDNLPFVEHPLECSEHQAFCLEVPIKSKDLTRWALEAAAEQLATLAAICKRARAEVSVKDLTPQELKLFEQAKAKELQCWIQTSAIRTVLRRRLNSEQKIEESMDPHLEKSRTW
eukprot:s2205_g1.t1